MLKSSLAFGFLLAATVSALAGDMIIALSPAMNPSTAKTETITVLQNVVSILEPGDKALILDAYNVRPVCTVAVPGTPAYRHEKAKLGANAKCIATVLKFATDSAPSAGLPSYAIRLPQLARYIGQNYPAANPTDVIIFGSVLHDDAREPGTSMLAGHVPSDGYLAAAATVSPYSTQAPKPFLAGMRVHFVTPGDAWQINTQHAELVRRFWTLFVVQNGGTLVTFAGSPTAAFDHVRSSSPPLSHGFSLGATDKLEMIAVRRDLKDRPPIHARELSTSPVPAEAVSSAQNVEIGITWTCRDCDVDLHATPYRGAETIYFANSVSQEGRLYKDFLQSPDLSNGLETIEFTKTVDLRKLILFVNFYRGAAPSGLDGEIRIALGEQTYAAPFHIAASRGNRGGGGNETLTSLAAPNEAWLRIDPLSVVRIR